MASLLKKDVESIIDRIPPPDVRDRWNFKILDKTSASTSLLILTNVAKPDDEKSCPRKMSGGVVPVAIKTWRVRNMQVDEEKALEYEKRVYLNKIKPILDYDEDEPFLRYLGDDNNCSTVESLAMFIGANDVGSQTALYLAFYVMNEMALNSDMVDAFTNNDIDINYFSRNFYSQFFSTFPSSQRDFLAKYRGVKDWKIGAIILPKIRFTTFGDLLKVKNANQYSVYRQVVKGLYTLYKNRTVHNDIHAGNIMVEEKSNKVMIYDWDRGYSPDLGINAILNSNVCRSLCSSSQCNIFAPNGRPIDLVKSMCYIVINGSQTRDELKNPTLRSCGLGKFLDELNIKNRIIRPDRKARYQIILDGIKDGGLPFFTVAGCSSLYEPGRSPALELAIYHLGETWDEIYARAFPPVRIVIPPEVQPRAKRYKVFLGAAVMAAGLANVAIWGGFGFSKQKFGVVTENPIDIVPKEIEKISGEQIKIDKDMANQMKELAQFPLNSEMKSEIERLQKIPENNLTWDDYISLKDLADYVQYGPELPIEQPEGLTYKMPPARPIEEIIQENDAMKLYPRN
jgi:serine/threonine protein kinase